MVRAQRGDGHQGGAVEKGCARLRRFGVAVLRRCAMPGPGRSALRPKAVERNGHVSCRPAASNGRRPHAHAKPGNRSPSGRQERRTAGCTAAARSTRPGPGCRAPARSSEAGTQARAADGRPRIEGIGRSLNSGRRDRFPVGRGFIAALDVRCRRAGHRRRGGDVMARKGKDKYVTKLEPNADFPPCRHLRCGPRSGTQHKDAPCPPLWKRN